MKPILLNRHSPCIRTCCAESAAMLSSVRPGATTRISASCYAAAPLGARLDGRRGVWHVGSLRPNGCSILPLQRCVYANAAPAGKDSGGSAEPEPAPSSAGRRGGKGGRGYAGAGAGPRARGSAPSAVAAAAQAAADALFTDPGAGPLAPQVGPVAIADLGDGRGRGLVASRTVQPGELLLAVRPLALAWDDGLAALGSSLAQDPVGSEPTPGTPIDEDLDPDLGLEDAKFLGLQRQLLSRRYTLREAEWLASLCGLPPVSEEGQEQGGKAPELPPAPALETVLAVGTDTVERRDVPLPDRLRNRDILADVVQANAFAPDGGCEDADAYWARRQVEDVAVGPMSPDDEYAAKVDAGDGDDGWEGDEEPEPAGPRAGPLGVWPGASLLNHSCMPNTVAFVVGDTLFVRAARKVAAGSELTVSYLPVGGGADTSVFGSEAGAAADDDGEGAAAEYEGGSGGRGTLLSPVEVRRAALEDSYGFVCGCGRCTTEEGLDPKLRALIADIADSTQGLREDLETALAWAEVAPDGEDDDEEDEDEEETKKPTKKKGKQQSTEDDDEEDEDEAGGATSGSKRQWRKAAASVVSQAGAYVELMDAAMGKLKLSMAEQETAQSAVVPLYTVLWAALAARGEIEPPLSEMVASLVGSVAPGSADHLWWRANALETAQILVAEEEMEAAAASTIVRGAKAGFGGFKRPEDDRVANAGNRCSAAFKIRYGPISRQVYKALLKSRRERDDAEGEAE
ncbi:hypothetical protein CHLRE_07g334250v5 [Chlamydomonas reinhardtii]|uniref:SET domain-containing protein n=1 Tax=Chlamydomonas reinhardtii TaxID=3055 RepID=A0A2K3DK27_CHLRE|nr:uncharacterized protein CHLRE_07g334250v5 [Chlamydomonas reinhardtii]PNW80897.1 hypothetical protein CHLRE_07g334250v5 [Chlamydomonas reinhardtii]